MATSTTPHAAALATLTSLEHRLQRLTFYLTGDAIISEEVNNVVTEANGREATAHARLLALEEKLANLSAQKPAVRNLLELHSIYPDLFHPSISSPITTTSLSPQELLAIITASAPEYHQTASRLTSLKDLPLPPADVSGSLIALAPRLAQVELEQEQQENEIAELRARSAKIVHRWYEIGVLGEGECWGEWEGRVGEVEKSIRRKELVREREQEEAQAYKS